MSHFMLLLHENPEMWKSASPEEMQKAIEKYYAWTKLPIVVDSKRLAAEPGKVRRGWPHGRVLGVAPGKRDALHLEADLEVLN